MFDVAIVGLGPAGRALASQCARRGSKVLAIDPNPDATWTPTYGLWADELGELPPDVVRASAHHPEVRARGVHDLGRTYVVLDNAATQAALALSGATIERARLDDRDVAALAGRARFVVDARGARPAGLRGDDAVPAQTAFGIVVDANAAAPALGGAEALLMDFRPDWAVDPANPVGPASFLYAIPVGQGRMLLEETCLAAAPGLGIDELKQRLRRRLERRGVAPGVLAAPLGREVVRIPMRGRDSPAPRPATALGTAGRGGHLVTGYSVAHSLRRAAPLADAIARGERPRPDPPHLGDPVRELALRALLRLDAESTIELFDAFGRLRPRQQRALLRRDSGAAAMLDTMWAMFGLMPGRARRCLIHATFGRS